MPKKGCMQMAAVDIVLNLFIKGYYAITRKWYN
jgi:hypothetical protein